MTGVVLPHHDDTAQISSTARKHIAIYVFDDVEELDVVGPWEVLSWWAQNFPEDGYSVQLFSDSAPWVRCAKGLELRAHTTRPELPPLEVLIYPGGSGTRRVLRDDPHLQWVREQRETVPLLASVCTGSLVYAAAGILRGRPATTHWASLEHLADLDPTVQVQADVRWVDDGDLITSAGVSAGIDMALYLVERYAGAERAAAVQRGIQYENELR